METINLGRVAFVYKGDYSALTTYNKMDVVFDGESSFVSQVDNNVGNELVNGLNWKYLSRGNNLELQEAKQDIAALETDLNALYGYNYTSSLEVGYSLVPSSTIIGDIVTITRGVNSVFNSIKLKVLKGEKLSFTGYGGSGPRLYYITDTSYKLLQIAGIAQFGTYTFTMNQDGYFVVNLRNNEPSYPPNLLVYSIYDSFNSQFEALAKKDVGIVSTITSENILYSVDVLIGTTMSTGNLSTGFPSRATTVLIKNGDKPIYINSSDVSKYSLRSTLYGSDGITVLSYNDAVNSNIVIPPNSYFRICFVKQSAGNIVDVNEIANVVKMLNYTTDEKIDTFILGDSIVEGYVSYLNNGVPTAVATPSKCWVTKLSQIRKDLFITNYGVGGQGFLDPSGGPGTTAREKVNSISFSNCDIALLGYGINDWKGNQILGSINDSTSLGTTVLSNMKYCIEKIISDNPACKIYILSPLNCIGYSSEFGDESTNYALGYSLPNTGTLESFVSKMKEVSEYYGVEFIDMTHNSVINRKSITSLLIDGVHPSEQCHLAIARELAYKI